MGIKIESNLDARTEQQIDLDKIQVERARFDLEQWRERAPVEILCTEVSLISDEQQMFRRNIDTLTTLRKTLTNGDLLTAVDKQLLVFVNALALTNTMAKLTTELK